MKIYVASSFLNKPEVKAAQEALVAAGHGIAHDWTPDVAPGAKGSDDFLRYCWHSGVKDYYGVQRADALIILNDLRGRDMLVEFGMALGARKPVFFVRGDAYKREWASVFLYCPGVVLCDTLEGALKELKRLENGFHLYTTGEPDCVLCGAFGPTDDNDTNPTTCEVSVRLVEKAKAAA